MQSLELDYDPLWGSMVKQAIRRVHPDFNEGYYGYRNFSDLLKKPKRRACSIWSTTRLAEITKSG